jgi:hypothetical protein
MQKYFMRIIFLCSTLIISLGFIGLVNEGFKSRLPPNIEWESFADKVKSRGSICDYKSLEDYKGIEICSFGEKNQKKKVLLYGDSHADSLSYYLSDFFKYNKIQGVRARIKNCEVIPNVIDTRDSIQKHSKCVNHFNQLVKYSAEYKLDIVVASRWSFKLYPVKGYIDEMPYVNMENVREKDAEYREYAVIKNGKLNFGKDSKQAALRDFVFDLLSTNQRIFLVYPIPEVGYSIARENLRNSNLNEISISTNEYLNRNRFVLSIFDSYANNKKFIPIRPQSVFCDTFLIDRCVAQYNTIPYYYDDDHLSYIGAKVLFESYLKYFN